MTGIHHLWRVYITNIKLCKYVLCTGKYSVNDAVRCELGRFPFMISILAHSFKYLKRLEDMPEGSLLKLSHLDVLQSPHLYNKQRWNDLHSLCRIGMEYYLLNNDDNNIIYWIMMIIMIMMMIIIMIIMMTMMIIGTATIMIMIIIITTTLTMTIMKMIMIKTAQTPCQSLYKDRRI